MSCSDWHNLFNPVTWAQPPYLTWTHISRPEPFQHADNHIQQIAVTLSQLAGGNLPEMSSAVMSWLNGVGEMATCIMPVLHMTASVHWVPKQEKVSGKYCVAGLATCCLYRSVSAPTLSPGATSVWSVTHCTWVLHRLQPSVYNWKQLAFLRRESWALNTTNRLLSHCLPHHLSPSPSFFSSLDVREVKTSMKIRTSKRSS